MNTYMRFKELIKDYKMNKKILITPNHLLANQHIRKSIENNIPVINLEITTIHELANNLCKEKYDLNYKEFKAISSEVATNIVMDILNKNLPKLKYFKKKEWIDIKTAEEITKQIYDIRLMEAEDKLKENQDNIKLEDIYFILKEYEKQIKEEEFLDESEVLKEAIKLLKEENKTEDIKYAIFANTSVAGLQRSFISALTKENIMIIKAPYIEGINIPNTYYSRETEAYEKSNEVAALYGDTNKKITKPNIEFFRAYGKINEFKYVMQDILKKNINFGDVEVIIVNKSYSLYIYNYACSIGIEGNISLKDGLPGYHSEIYAFIRDLFAFVENGYFIEDLRKIFSNRTLKLNLSKTSNRRIFSRLLDKNIGFSRKRLENMCINEGISEDNDNFTMINFLKDILSLYPENFDEIVDLKEFVINVVTFMRMYCIKDNEKINKELSCYYIALTTFAKYSIIDMPLKDAMEQILNIMAKIKIDARDAEENTILVSSYKTIGQAIRPYVYVIGLNADTFPVNSNESPVLLDDERKKLGMEFNLACDSENNSIYELLKVISGDIKNLCVGYNYFDTVGIKEKNCSSFYNRLLNNADKKIEDISKVGFIGEPESILEQKEYYLYKEETHSEEDKYIVREKYENNKSEDYKAENNGNNMVFSASSIDVFLSCPKKFFYKYIAKLDPREDDEYERTAWLDPAQKGTLIHSILENYVKNVIIELNIINFDNSKFEGIFDAECNNMIEKVPYLSETAYNMQKKEYKRDCKNAIDNLLERMNDENFVPVRTEMGFGKDNPVEIQVNGVDTIKFTGSIDRVDSLGENKYRIVDYKTGKYEKMKNKRNDTHDLLIQDYIYALVLEKVFDDTKKEVIQSSYEFPCDGNAQLKTKITPEVKGDTLSKLEEILNSIRKMEYEGCNENKEKYIDYERTCKYCKYSELCNAEINAWGVK